MLFRRSKRQGDRKGRSGRCVQYFKSERKKEEQKQEQKQKAETQKEEVNVAKEEPKVQETAQAIRTDF